MVKTEMSLPCSFLSNLIMLIFYFTITPSRAVSKPECFEFFHLKKNFSLTVSQKNFEKNKNEFELGKLRMRARVSSSELNLAEMDSDVYSKTEKAGFLLAFYEIFLEQKIWFHSKESEIEFANFLIRKTKLSKGVIRSQEAYDVGLLVFDYLDRQGLRLKNKVKAWLVSSYVNDFKQVVFQEMIRRPEFQILAKTAFSKEVTVPSKEKRRLVQSVQNSWSLMKYVLVNMILIKVGIFPFYLPKLSFIEFNQLPKAVQSRERIHLQVSELIRMAISEASPSGRIHQTYQCVQKGIRSALLVFFMTTALVMPLETFHFVEEETSRLYFQGKDLLQVMSYSMSTETERKENENADYHPNEVVQQLLQSWIQSEKTPPTPEQIEEKRKEISEYEKNGELRVYR